MSFLFKKKSKKRNMLLPCMSPTSEAHRTIEDLDKHTLPLHLCQYVVSIRQSLFFFISFQQFQHTQSLQKCTFKLRRRKESVLFCYLSLLPLFLITFYKCNSHLLSPPLFFLPFSVFVVVYFFRIHMQTKSKRSRKITTKDC